MWSFRTVELHGQRSMHFTVHLDSQPAGFADVLRAWQNDAVFRSHFNAQLADAPYAPYRQGV
jgi:hypothetical protein